MAELPKGAVALYRIMTRKSVLGFGKFSDLPIGDILKIEPSYVVWAYASFDKISLHKDIIEELGIREIKKPGHDMTVLYEWEKARSAQFTKEERMHGALKKKIGRKKQAIAILKRVERDNAYYGENKARLQAINHGHIKTH